MPLYKQFGCHAPHVLLVLVFVLVLEPAGLTSRRNSPLSRAFRPDLRNSSRQKMSPKIACRCLKLEQSPSQFCHSPLPYLTYLTYLTDLTLCQPTWSFTTPTSSPSTPSSPA